MSTRHYLFIIKVCYAMIQYLNNQDSLSVVEESYQGFFAHFSSFEIAFITSIIFLFIMIGGWIGVKDKKDLFKGRSSVRILVEWFDGILINVAFEVLINVVLLLFFYHNPYHLYTVMFVIVHIVLFNCKKQES